MRAGSDDALSEASHMESPRLKIMICDDEPRLCSAWERLLASQKDMDFVGAFECADGLVEAIGTLAPSVVLMDLTMPGRDPIEVLQEASSQHPDSRIIVYSGFSDAETIQKVIDAGAWGLVDKLQPPIEILDAIRRVARGEALLPSDPGNPR